MKRYTEEFISDLLPFPRKDANKYTRGKVVLVVGSNSYPGAAVLASLASQRAGAGYTEAFVEDGIVSQVQMYHPSLVVRPWSAFTERDMKESTAHHPCAYVVGSGFDARDPIIATMTRRLLKAAKAPVLVDGGALRLLSARKIRELCEARFHEGHPTIITPHGGEAAALAKVFNIPTDDPQDLALMLSQAYGAITVLKGPDTYITDGDGIYCMDKGTPALAKAGTGDVLAGIIGALLAQGLGPVQSCVLGTTLHARAGALAAEDYSEISVCAEEVIQYLPNAIFEMKRKADAARGQSIG
ncbi:MAG: NAD(P)H-hydrate dehydratase [Eggerthellaceae bacterium]|nr:NAD(P)H-hydrate dehydratase [Eggerthellaceae bacterium]